MLNVWRACANAFFFCAFYLSTASLKVYVRSPYGSLLSPPLRSTRSAWGGSIPTLDFFSCLLRVYSTPRHRTASQLLRWRNQSFEDSFQEIRSKAMPQQARIVFENLSVLQQSIQNDWALPKRPHHEDVSTLTQSTNETSTNASSNKKSFLSHPLSTEGTQLGQTTQQLLKPMDTNIPHIRMSHHNQKDNGSSTGISTTSKQNYRDLKRAERR
jgi:hypothetical protein